MAGPCLTIQTSLFGAITARRLRGPPSSSAMGYFQARTDRVVLAAIIDLTRCLDLTQIRWRELVAEVGAAVPKAIADRLRQNEFNRGLDCWVINRVIEQTRYEDGSPRFTTVRGAFQEGEAIYRAGVKASAIRTLDHVQLCVVDDAAMLNVLEVTRPIVID